MSEIRGAAQVPPPLMAGLAVPPAIAIEKGVPIPLKGRGGGRPWRWPFREMEIGDSFSTPLKDGETATMAMRRVDYIYAGKRFGRRYTGRCLYENGVRVVRVWRVA